MGHNLILRPRVFEPLGWLDAGMTTRVWAAGAPDETRQAMALRLRDELGLSDAKVVLAEQVHRCGVAGGEQGASMPCALQNESALQKKMSGNLSPRDALREIPGVDALVTKKPRTLIGIFTADCVPVALADPRMRNLAVAHAGREGTLLGIIRKTVECLREMGSSPRDLLAWIGPSICAAHYEVGAEIAAEFRELFGREAGVVSGADGRHLNLTEMNRLQLVECGVKPARIESDPRCTFEDAGLFHSYRREGAAAGRMLTFAGIRDAN